jgi:hypothetical protein|tara:strand:+ start:3389 stop:3760 length:372 start_codon:yes stop_codon:yes gene_type:complete
MNLETVRVIGNVLETTWGKSSSADGTYSIKYVLDGSRLTLQYTMIVYFAGEQSLRPQVDTAYNQAIQLVDAKLGEVKSAYKAVAGTALKIKDVGGQDNLELIQPQGPRKIAYYRYNHVFQIED